MADHDESRRRQRTFVPAIVLLAGALTGEPRPAAAANGDCAQPVSSGAAPTATDALFVLKVAVGVGACELCTCDTDGSGTITATDSLRTLRAAVGIAADLVCPACPSLCDALVQIDASAETFDTIEIGNVPVNSPPPWAILTPSDGGDDGTALVLLDAGGSERLMVPLHPGGGVAGGSVSVSISNGSEICPIGSLTILPLDPAPADTAANVLAAFLALNDALASDFGMTGAELATTPLDELPSLLFAPAVAQILLAGPDNENSLAAFVDGTAPLLDDDADMDAVNRLLAKIGIEDALQQMLTNRTPITPSPLAVRQRARASGTESCGLLMRPVELEITTAAELSRLMKEGQAARDGQVELGNQFIADSLGTLVNTIAVVVRPLRAIGSMLLYAWGMQQRWLGDLYPSLLTRIDFDVEDDGRFPEDRMDPGDGGLAPPPQWTNPRIYAASLGTEVSRTAIEDLIDFAAFLPAMPDAIEDDPLLETALEAVNEVYEFFGDEGCVSVSPSAWGPIEEAYDPQYVEPLYFGNSVAEVDFGSFEPIALGTTTLRLRTTEAFSGPAVSADRNIEVVGKKLSMDVPTINAKPGDPVEVVAAIFDSYRPEMVEWEYPDFVGNPVIGRPAANSHTLTFTAPTDRALYPFEVRAFSTSLTLDPPTPAREATATIETGAGVTIAPRGGCVANGGQLDLVAEVTGLADDEDDSVSWSQFGEGDLTPGEDNTAVYTAPSDGSGEVLIAATLQLDDEVSDEVSILYGACDVNLDLGWYAGSSTFDPDLPPDVDQSKSAYLSGPLFPDEDDLLVPPDSWWNGRGRTVTTENGSTYEVTVYDDEAFEHQLTLGSESRIEAEMTSLGGGAAELSMTWSTSAECRSIPNTANGVTCSDARAEFTWNPVIWIEVSEPGTYHAQFTLGCSGGDSEGLYFVGATTLMRRHVGGAAKGAFPNGGVGDPLYIDGLNPFDAPTPPPNPYFTVTASNFVCEPGAPSIVAQKVFELKGATNPPEPDIVALAIWVGALMVSPFDPFTETEGPPVPQTQSGSIHSSVTIARVDP